MYRTERVSSSTALERRTRTPFAVMTMAMSMAMVLAMAVLLVSCGSPADVVAEAESIEDSAEEVASAVTDGADSGGNDDAPDSGGGTEDHGTEDDATDGDGAGEDGEDGEDGTGRTEVAVVDDEQVAAAAPSAQPVSWDGSFATSIQPIIEAKCASCHFAGGPGSPHWRIETAQDLVDTHRLLSGVVANGTMPPWIAGGDSPAFHNDRSLSADQVQAIIDWSADGAPLDVDPATTIEPLDGLLRLNDATDVVTQASYTGVGTATDDYRCQLYELELPPDGWITGLEFLPDNQEVVHHMIGYLIEGEDALARAAELDGADGRPGWPCYGNSGLGRDELIVGWAPGQEPYTAPDGYGIPYSENAAIVGQLHYHYETFPEADASQFAVRTAGPEADLNDVVIDIMVAPAEIPCSTEEQGPLCDRDTAYAAAIEKYGHEGVRSAPINAICGWDVEDFASMTDGVAWSDCTFPAPAGELESVFGHMHEIGATFRMVLNPGRADEMVLLDIPDWDFDWQYQYDPIPDVTFVPGDEIRMECSWDRSRLKPGIEPAYILWADGTNDEMCFGTVTTLEP